VAGDRRDFFTAEAELRKIVSGFVNEQIRPHLDSGKARMKRMENLLAEETSEQKEFVAERIERLQGWQKRANALLPFALNFIKPD
jgi:DNA-binding transcriptional regulator GbsR (MarR family)